MGVVCPGGYRSLVFCSPVCAGVIIYHDQAGPVVNVHMPKDRVTMQHQGYGFVEFLSEDDADYSIKIMNMIKLFGKPVRVNKASAHQKNLDVGANIFIGKNVAPSYKSQL